MYMNVRQEAVERHRQHQQLHQLGATLMQVCANDALHPAFAYTHAYLATKAQIPLFRPYDD